ncbi:hypothetical protein GCM10023310_70670 [Paenibacillus vulneris]|uniref:Uncharacterized protein n=1 Tax=Paenibacillus vulneris TaxID=1133364 RepID=A0ABW3UGY2_9BACL
MYYIRKGYVVCPHCGHERGRKGRIRRYKHIDDGICVVCNGEGEITVQRSLQIKEQATISDYERFYSKSMTFEEYKLMRKKEDEEIDNMFD